MRIKRKYLSEKFFEWLVYGKYVCGHQAYIVTYGGYKGSKKIHPKPEKPEPGRECPKCELNNLLNSDGV